MHYFVEYTVKKDGKDQIRQSECSNDIVHMRMRIILALRGILSSPKLNPRLAGGIGTALYAASTGRWAEIEGHTWCILECHDFDCIPGVEK